MGIGVYKEEEVRSLALHTGLLAEGDGVSAVHLQEAIQLAFPDLRIHYAQTLVQAQGMLLSLRPHLIAVSTNLVNQDFMSQARECMPGACIVVGAGHDEDDRILPSLRAGADGYLLKREPQVAIARTLRDLLQGAPPMSRALARQILKHFAGVSARDPLEAGEYEMLITLAAGASLDEAAEQLEADRSALDARIRAVYAKLRFSNRPRMDPVSATRATGHA
jgi:DNA-binding NarL/FixJ family response regulator